jgi:hypothetical protein
MRRIFWLALGLGAGATVGLAFNRWARQKSRQLGPANLGRQAAGVLSDVGTLLREAAAEFQRGATEKEREIRTRLDE